MNQKKVIGKSKSKTNVSTSCYHTQPKIILHEASFVIS